MSSTFSIFTNLYNCLVSCSIVLSSEGTTIVIREIPISSAGPTAKLSILNPRLANNPAIRVNTPDSSSTRTDKVCFILVRDSIDGLIYSDKRALTLEKALLKIVNNEDWISDMGANARQDALVRFNQNVNFNKIYEILVS